MREARRDGGTACFKCPQQHNWLQIAVNLVAIKTDARDEFECIAYSLKRRREQLRPAQQRVHANAEAAALLLSRRRILPLTLASTTACA